MDFFKKNTRDTLEAINKCIDMGIETVDTKRIRRCNHIKAFNRSKINFIWRSLEYLEGRDILEKNGISKPKTFIIKPKDKIDVDKFISEM